MLTRQHTSPQAFFLPTVVFPGLPSIFRYHLRAQRPPLQIGLFQQLYISPLCREGSELMIWAVKFVSFRRRDVSSVSKYQNRVEAPSPYSVGYIFGSGRRSFLALF